MISFETLYLNFCIRYFKYVCGDVTNLGEKKRAVTGTLCHEKNRGMILHHKNVS